VKLDVRARYEFANQNGKEHSNAGTIRTRLGYETAEWEGLSAYVEMENVATLDDDWYQDPTQSSNGKTVIADPANTEVNQAFAKISRPELGGTKLIGGRQRIVWDDARFIGNVGWRQNEQTYDSTLFQSALGVEDLQLRYGYVWEVKRIFGDQGGPATADFDSESHLIHLSYDKLSYLKPTFFTYLLDFSNSDGNSANTFGLRLTGSVPLNDDLEIVYAGSYAYQEDAADNPTSYDTHYYALDAKFVFKPLGALGGGYEVLGSDDGKHQFSTPLATAHKFNGWADVFLNNGGANGLRDGYVYLAPRLPWGLKAKLVYHHFESDNGGNNLGDEYDAVISRQFGKYVNVLGKAAYYNSSSNSASPDDIVRFWIQAQLKF
jgi:hypothetical protein